MNPPTPPTYTPVVGTGTNYLDYEYVGSGFTLVGIYIKVAAGGTLFAPVNDLGTLGLPQGTSHVTFCFEDGTTGATTTTLGNGTTTTTGSGDTTTTVGGPDDPTTTTTLGNGTTTTTLGNGTTTTTGSGDTTTTVGGPDDPTTTTTGGGDTTTTTGGTTTSVLGPDDPELPDNGAGHLLAILLGGMGLVFMGSGSLVIASERRRLIR